MRPPHGGQSFKPEMVLKRAEELENAGQEQNALTQLHEWVVNRRYKTFNEHYEALMTKLITLSVRQSKQRMAKDALQYYRNSTMNVSLPALEKMVDHWLMESGLNVQNALSKAGVAADVSGTEAVDGKTVSISQLDLDDDLTPQAVMEAALSQNDELQTRLTRRELLLPAFRFHWESFRSILDLLKMNAKVELIYHKVALQAFDFCVKYQRKTELRRIADLLRNHVQSLHKIQSSSNAQTYNIDLMDDGSFKNHIEVRVKLLQAAKQLNLFQEMNKSIEDVQFLLSVAQYDQLLPVNGIKLEWITTYYEALADILLQGEHFLHHSVALLRMFIAMKESKSSDAGKLKELADRILISALACSDIAQLSVEQLSEEDRDREQKLSFMVGFESVIVTRQWLVSQIKSLDLCSAASDGCSKFYRAAESATDAKSKLSELQQSSKVIMESQLSVYLSPVYQSFVFCYCIELGKKSETIALDQLLETAKVVGEQSYTSIQLQQALTKGVKLGKFKARICQASAQVKFTPSHQKKTGGVKVTDLLSQLQTQLKSAGATSKDGEQSVRRGGDDRVKLVEKQLESWNQLVEQRTRTLQQERQLKAQQEADAEKVRLLKEQREKELENIKKHREQLEKERAQKIADELKQKNVNIAAEDLETMDKNKLLKMQIEQIESEKKAKEQKLSALCKRIDHVERACRQEEAPLIAASYEKQKQLDVESHRKAHELLLEATKRQFDKNFKLKQSLGRLQSNCDEFKEAKLAALRQKSKKKVEEAKKAYEAEKEALLEQLRVEKYERLLKEQKERKERELQELEEQKKREEQEKVQKERIEALKKEKEEREQQMKEAQEIARLRMQKEQEAERRMQERLSSASKPSFSTAIPATTTTQAESDESSSGKWIFTPKKKSYQSSGSKASDVAVANGSGASSMQSSRNGSSSSLDQKTSTNGAAPKDKFIPPHLRKKMEQNGS
ncbi:hypothetical protein MP228_010115 [Amoeboaphelidium protococcarum]|nr:hypothetical protein MP228_010115 [Amoeboaphelidium protococcarum]